MDDLISRSDLIKRIKGFTNISSEYFENPELLLDVIENQPAAYNVEKVVAELEKEIKWAETHGTSADFRKGRISGLKTAIRIVNSIVKRGGVDERA